MCSAAATTRKRLISLLTEGQSLHLRGRFANSCCCDLESVFFVVLLLNFGEKMRLDLLFNTFSSAAADDGCRRDIDSIGVSIKAKAVTMVNVGLPKALLSKLLL